MPKLSRTELLEKILNVTRTFAEKNDQDSEDLVERVKNRLCYSTTAGPNKQKNLATMREDIKNMIIQDFIDVAENPSEEQKEFYEKVLNLAKTKLVKNNYKVPDRLLDYKTHPISKDEIREAVKQAFINQNVATTPEEIEEFVVMAAERLAGHKHLVEELLPHYRPVKDRPIYFSELDGQKRRLFGVSHDILTQMDDDVLEIDEKIKELKEKRKAEIAQLESEGADIKEKLVENTAKVKELNGQWNAIQKLIDGIKKFFGVFTTENHVNVHEEKPTEFFDNHFNIPAIIDHEVSMTADLTFTPPEYYEVQHDMEVQREQLHGLDDSTELRAEGTVINAGKIVARESAEVQGRENVVLGLVEEHVLEERQEVTLKKDPALVVVNKPVFEVEPLQPELVGKKGDTREITHKYKTRLHKEFEEENNHEVQVHNKL